MTADEIRKAVMERRAAQGLKLRLQTPEGETTLYPKDKETLEKWRRATQAKGYEILQ